MNTGAFKLYFSVLQNDKKIFCSSTCSGVIIFKVLTVFMGRLYV